MEIVKINILLRSQLLSVKSSNQRMEEEMRQIKSVNINLRNDVRQ